MILKILLVMALLLSAGKGCNPSAQLPVAKATSQAWSGGAAGSGRGINYAIYIPVKWTEDYTFDSLWVKEKRLPIDLDKRLSVGDTIVLTATDLTQSIRNIGDIDTFQDEVKPVPLPVSGSAEAVLGYHFKGEQHYLLIESWTVLKPLYYP